MVSVSAIFQLNQQSIQLRKASAGYHALVSVTPFSTPLPGPCRSTVWRLSQITPVFVPQVSAFSFFTAAFFITIDTHRAHCFFFLPLLHFPPRAPHRVGAFNTIYFVGFLDICFRNFLGKERLWRIHSLVMESCCIIMLGKVMSCHSTSAKGGSTMDGLGWGIQREEAGWPAVRLEQNHREGPLTG